MKLQTMLPKKLLLGGQSLGVWPQTNTIPLIGTLTFIEPMLYRYGALGHFLPTNWTTSLRNWTIRSSTIKAIQKTTKDSLGSKIGTTTDSGCSGNIRKNTKHGIFGEIRGFEPNPYFKEPIPVGNLEDIITGPATIYTVVEKEQVEEFNIVIESVLMARKKAPYLAIKIIDSDLIHKAGGIVRGMSGSPIVQNGKLIGAISYLSAHHSQRGYGVFIGNMLNDLSWNERSFSLQSMRKLFSRVRGTEMLTPETCVVNCSSLINQKFDKERRSFIT